MADRRGQEQHTCQLGDAREDARHEALIVAGGIGLRRLLLPLSLLLLGVGRHHGDGGAVKGGLEGRRLSRCSDAIPSRYLLKHEGTIPEYLSLVAFSFFFPLFFPLSFPLIPTRLLLLTKNYFIDV